MAPHSGYSSQARTKLVGIRFWWDNLVAPLLVVVGLWWFLSCLESTGDTSSGGLRSSGSSSLGRIGSNGGRNTGMSVTRML